MILHIVANLLNMRIVGLRYYPLTNEYKLPHKHFITSPVDVALELPMSMQQTIMLLKNSKHYDGLIFFIFHFQVSCFYNFFKETICTILEYTAFYVNTLKTQDNTSNRTSVSYITNSDNVLTLL